MNKLFCAAVLAAGLSCAPAWAVFDNYLKIDGIDGEATSKGHEKWIDISSWSWGVSQVDPTSGGGGSSKGKAVFQDFAWAQGIDASVVPLFLGVAAGTDFKDATLDVVRAGGKNSGSFFQMIFSDVTLNSLVTSGNDDSLNASGALDYSAVTMRYRPQKDNGSYDAWIEGTFSLKDNKVQFSGDPKVIQGLFSSGGNVSLSTIAPAVPEPASWALMAAGGLLLLGTTAARRRHGV